MQRFPDFAPAQRDPAVVMVNDPAKRDAAYEVATKPRRTISGDPLISIVLRYVSYMSERILIARSSCSRKVLAKNLSALDPYTILAWPMRKPSIRPKPKKRSIGRYRAGWGTSKPARQNGRWRILAAPKG